MNCVVFVFIAGCAVFGAAPSPVDYDYSTIAMEPHYFALPGSIHKITNITVKGQTTDQRGKYVFELQTEEKGKVCEVVFEFSGAAGADGDDVVVNAAADRGVPSSYMFIDSPRKNFVVTFTISIGDLIDIYYGSGSVYSECKPMKPVETVTHLVVWGKAGKVNSLDFTFH